MKHEEECSTKEEKSEFIPVKDYEELAPYLHKFDYLGPLSPKKKEAIVALYNFMMKNSTPEERMKG